MKRKIVFGLIFILLIYLMYALYINEKKYMGNYNLDTKIIEVKNIMTGEKTLIEDSEDVNEIIKSLQSTPYKKLSGGNMYKAGSTYEMKFNEDVVISIDIYDGLKLLIFTNESGEHEYQYEAIGIYHIQNEKFKSILKKYFSNEFD
ncbi:hypothetical protein [Miniphocaeibacter halophilus]|uniref:Uncharacterized protein n=1 Tax=Miniphocaeibacter halophilus TaxID=2931922 RepID=A0AC61MQV0_9FIRM|nr:hypothetical protein [Miniphocaeibacter halophilus]QQK07862.1 hypothetical protein JFY71_11405 [Miniphocaeibacter halophilus]